MSIKKEYSKDKSICKVTFSLPAQIVDQFDHISLVGDFNNWDPNKNQFSHKNDGSSKTSIELETDKEYEFRYLANGETWLNENDADKHILTAIGSTNSVVVL